MFSITKYFEALEVIDWIIISICFAVALGSLVYVFLFSRRKQKIPLKPSHSYLGTKEPQKNVSDEQIKPSHVQNLIGSTPTGITTVEQSDKQSNNRNSIQWKDQESAKPEKDHLPVGEANKVSPLSIHFMPTKQFEQQKPYSYPYVLMPEEGSLLKRSKPGSLGRQGYKEEEFKTYLDKFFSLTAQILTNHVVNVKKTSYQPDFTLIHDPNGKRIFIDIEIDEPYEGLDDLVNRRPLHYRGYNDIRDNSFIERGWVVIRFAEFQVHNFPASCCRFIAEVLYSIAPFYIIPLPLQKSPSVANILQWTQEEARRMSNEKYRERYLGIQRFGVSEKPNIVIPLDSDEDSYVENNLAASLMIEPDMDDVSVIEEGIEDYTPPSAGHVNFTGDIDEPFLPSEAGEKEDFLEPVKNLFRLPRQSSTAELRVEKSGELSIAKILRIQGIESRKPIKFQPPISSRYIHRTFGRIYRFKLNEPIGEFRFLHITEADYRSDFHNFGRAEYADLPYKYDGESLKIGKSQAMTDPDLQLWLYKIH